MSPGCDAGSSVKYAKLIAVIIGLCTALIVGFKHQIVFHILLRDTMTQP